MLDKIGRFEVLSEIARADASCIYKVSDPDNGQIVALKTIELEPLGEEAPRLVQRVLEEAETTKPLSSHNIAQLFGAGEIEGRFCAAMEYVQGKSIATMLAKEEAFSIWDLQDITRQACQALDHAHTRKVVHYSLEPGKVLVSWDGTVKILGFGISSMNAAAIPASGKAPEIAHYMSPEQLRGETLDARSNLFSLGAILYEMVTDRKAFASDDSKQLRQEIAASMPVAPVQIDPKINPGLSELIMKALSKMPDQRYQSGQDLIADLEKCNESKAPEAKQPAPEPPRKAPEKAAKSAPLVMPPVTARKAASAAAGVGGLGASWVEGLSSAPVAHANVSTAWPGETETEPQPTTGGEPETSAGPKRRSFSEIDELPPLKEVYVEPPPPAEEVAQSPEPEAAPSATTYQAAPKVEEKLPPKEIAKKAVNAVVKTPPKLFLYSLAGAVFIILLVLGMIYSHNRSENAAENAPPPQATEPVAGPQPAPATPAQAPPTPQIPIAIEAPAPAQTTQPDVIAIKPKYGKHKSGKVAAAPPPAIVPGELNVNSTPEGAQVLVDGHHNPSWITPYDMTGLAPGQHLISVSKSGYAAENRTIEVASGSKSFLVVELAAVGASAFVSSVPTGGQVFLDGKDTGRLTPAQLQFDKPGTHIFSVRKQGFLEENTTANLQAGQTFQFAPVLRALGNADDIRLAGKFKKIFGGGDTSGMGLVNIRTEPKGAQIAVNHHILDKVSPVGFYAAPGTYVIDITLSGFKDVHRVVNVDRGGKLAIDETLER